MKKILISFTLGLLLSIVPITGLAASGKSFTIKQMFFGDCPETFDIPPFPGAPPEVPPIKCKLTGEAGDDGDGVSVCSYECLPITVLN